jgi:hypothetical protein
MPALRPQTDRDLILPNTFNGEKPMKTALAFVFLISASTANAQPTEMSDQEVITSLNGAAPQSIVENATIVKMSADGKLTTIREGSSGWTCMDARGEPMCADKAGMEWGKAWMDKAPAPQKLGFIYMLKGDHGTSNTDPYAEKETPDNNWVKTGPHVMIVGAEAKTMTQAYPRDPKPDSTKPYVMWPGTPYEHLMLPVQ